MAPNRRFAISYTVKNEANLLPDAIAYHLAMGCHRIYVFFDGTTDNTRELVEDIEQVVCMNSVDPKSLGDAPDWIKQVLPQWKENMNVRKRVNTYMSVQYARDDAIEWLINIDADELLLMHDGTRDLPGNPDDFFSSIPKDIDQILVPNFEAVPVGEGSDRPFVDCTQFLRRFPVTEFLWRCTSALVRRAVSWPKLHAWYDYWFYYCRFAGSLPRLMRHPTTGESIPGGYFLGYSNHKAFIRVGVASNFFFNIHKWQKDKRRPQNIKRGCLLHYDLCSAEYFCAKFRQRQSATLVKAFFCRHMFAQIARELPFDVARQFFLSNICVSDAALLRRLRSRGILAEVSFISHFMKQRTIP